MLYVYHGIRNLICAGCFSFAILGSSLSAKADFIPDKGIRVRRWKEAKDKGNYSRYYWLNEHELVYVSQDTGPGEQYCKLDLTTGKEQILLEFTKRVQDTVGSATLPDIYPSPDGKYVAWIRTSNTHGDTLIVATREGSVISRKPHRTSICYPAWSADSQWCFGFLLGQTSGDSATSLRAYTRITAISAKTPSVVKTYPIVVKSLMDPIALSGHEEALSFHEDTPPSLPDFHFGSNNNILVVASKSGNASEELQFDEYKLIDTSKPVKTHTMHMPFPGEIKYAVISPKGDAIVWKLQKEKDDELWISDQYGGHLKKLGKLHPSTEYKFFHTDHEHMQWLPDGKGISFLNGDDLYVVYLDAKTVRNAAGYATSLSY